MRLEVIQTRLITAFNVCITAENALVLNRVRHGREAIEKARHTAQSIRAHISEPGHVPADSVSGVLGRLAELEKQISKVEERFSL